MILFALFSHGYLVTQQMRNHSSLALPCFERTVTTTYTAGREFVILVRNIIFVVFYPSRSPSPIEFVPLNIAVCICVTHSCLCWSERTQSYITRWLSVMYCFILSYPLQFSQDIMSLYHYRFLGSQLHQYLYNYVHQKHNVQSENKLQYQVMFL